MIVYLLKGTYVIPEEGTSREDLLGIFDSVEATLAYVNIVYPGDTKRELDVDIHNHVRLWQLVKPDDAPGREMLWIEPSVVKDMQFVNAISFVKEEDEKTNKTFDEYIPRRLRDDIRKRYSKMGISELCDEMTDLEERFLSKLDDAHVPDTLKMDISRTVYKMAMGAVELSLDAVCETLEGRDILQSDEEESAAEKAEETDWLENGMKCAFLHVKRNDGMMTDRLIGYFRTMERARQYVVDHAPNGCDVVESDDPLGVDCLADKAWHVVDETTRETLIDCWAEEATLDVVDSEFLYMPTDRETEKASDGC